MFEAKHKDALAHHPAFYSFLGEVYELRESAIQQLHDRSSESVQQIAGRILQCDDILKMGGWDEMKGRKAE